MKIFMVILVLVNIATFATGCSREAQREEEIKKEKGIREDDIREDDSYERSVPVQKEEIDPNIDILDFETDEDSKVE